MQALAKNVRVIPANPMLTPTGRPKSAKERVAAYCRVSTDEEDQLNSFNSQREYYTKLINETEEWTFAGIYADEGITGTSMEKRTDFLKMLRACKQHKIDRILCKSLSRFARNTVDCLETVRELKGMGIAVYFEKEQIDTLKQQSEFVITLYSSFAQAESESISANVRMGKRMAYAQGKGQVRTDLLIGFTKDTEGNIAIEPKGAATVMRIYSSYLAGMSLDQIRDELIADGIPTAKNVKAWSKEGIRNILTNERYIGDALLQKWYKESCFTKYCKKNNGELPQYYVENNHPAIVSRELFNRVQSEIARRANRTKAISPTGERLRGKYSAKYALTEKLVCGECGTPYRRCTWTQKGVKRAVWRCISRLDYGKKYCHNSPTIDEYVIHNAILKAMNTLIEDKDEILAAVTEAIHAAFDNGKEENNLATLKQRLNDLKTLINDLADKVMDGIDGLDEQLAESMKELETIEEAIRQRDREQMAAEQENTRLKKIMNTLEGTSCALTEYDDILVRKIVDKVVVDGKDQVTVSFGYGVDVSVGIERL